MSSCKSLLLVVIMSCFISAGFAQEPTDSTSDPSGASMQSPANPARSNHVVVVMEENRSVTQALEYMPYLKSLAQQYAEGMQVYSDSHGSWLAYGELTSGLHPFEGSGDGGGVTGTAARRRLRSTTW